MKHLFLAVGILLISFVNCSAYKSNQKTISESCGFKIDLQANDHIGEVVLDTTYLDFQGVKVNRRKKKIFLNELRDLADSSFFIISTRRWNNGELVMDRINGDIPFEHYDKYSTFVLSELLPKSDRIKLERPYTYDNIDGCEIESLSNKLHDREFYRVRLDIFPRRAHLQCVRFIRRL